MSNKWPAFFSHQFYSFAYRGTLAWVRCPKTFLPAWQTLPRFRKVQLDKVLARYEGLVSGEVRLQSPNFVGLFVFSQTNRKTSCWMDSCEALRRYVVTCPCNFSGVFCQAGGSQRWKSIDWTWSPKFYPLIQAGWFLQVEDAIFTCLHLNKKNAWAFHDKDGSSIWTSSHHLLPPQLWSSRSFVRDATNVLCSSV